MPTPLMPKGTAVWLIDNTALTFQQIADFCGLHLLEIKAIADEEVKHILPFDPIAYGQLTPEEIQRAEKNPDVSLNLQENDHMDSKKRKVYVPRAKRQDRPNAILWVLYHFPHAPTNKICKLLGTTKNTVEALQTKKHPKFKEFTPKDPVKLGICSAQALTQILGPRKDI